MANDLIPNFLLGAINTYKTIKEQQALQDLLRDIWGNMQKPITSSGQTLNVSPPTPSNADISQILNQIMVGNAIKQANAQKLMQNVLTNAWLAPEHKNALLQVVQNQYSPTQINWKDILGHEAQMRKLGIEETLGKQEIELKKRDLDLREQIHKDEQALKWLQSVVGAKEYRYNEDGSLDIIDKINNTVQTIKDPNPLFVQKIQSQIKLTEAQAKEIADKMENLEVVNQKTGIVLVNKKTGDTINIPDTLSADLMKAEINLAKARANAVLADIQNQKEKLTLEKEKLTSKEVKPQELKSVFSVKNDTFQTEYRRWTNFITEGIRRGTITKEDAINHPKNLIYRFTDYIEGQALVNRLPDVKTSKTTPKESFIGTFNLNGKPIKIYRMEK